MPTLSRFHGITIQMYWDDRHGPHFHAYYGEHEALISILDGSYLAGNLPRRSERLALQWLELNRAALLENWRRAQNREPFIKIEGLK